MEAINNWLSTISGWVWGPPMLILLFGTHLYLTFRLRFIQRYVLHGIRLSLHRKREGAGDISHFGALMTALAATIGTGNIVGVATAVAAGGPGAVLWMWLTGVFGMATKYGEAVLSIKYRVTMPDGSMAGGPMFVLDRGMRNKPLAWFFAIMTVVASFGIGNMVQSNAVANMMQETFHVAPWISGVVMAAIVGVVILGGIRSIARVCQALVPVMAIGYCLGCLVILALGWRTLPHTVGLIFSSAFTGQAAVGGFLGAGIREAIRFGIARGLFSNESGMGSAPIVAAAAQTPNPVRQALVSATGTFWDTVVICAMTGLVVVNSGEWMNGLKGAALSKAAFDSLPVFGPAILTFGLLTFVFSTLLGWSYYGEIALEYLFGRKAILPYRIAWVIAVMAGSLSAMPLVWNFADVANGLMALPNLVALLVLAPVLVAETKEHLWKARVEAFPEDKPNTNA